MRRQGPRPAAGSAQTVALEVLRFPEATLSDTLPNDSPRIPKGGQETPLASQPSVIFSAKETRESSALACYWLRRGGPLRAQRVNATLVVGRR